MKQKGKKRKAVQIEAEVNTRRGRIAICQVDIGLLYCHIYSGSASANRVRE
jgi:hypothetical protein